jgi:hypothetical protein
VVVTVGAMAALAALQLPAASHQSPEPCNSNDPGLNLTKDRTWIRGGDKVTYKVEVSNLSTPNGPACHFTSATVKLTLPAADGTPSGAQTILASGIDLPAGTTLTQLPPVTWTVDLAPGVTDAVAKAEITGVLHDAPTDHGALVVKSLGTAMTSPFTILQATAEPASGPAPLQVTFTYVERNTGDSGITDIVLTDDVCAPVQYQSGDNDDDRVLDVGEAWTFTCTTTLQTPGTVTTHVVGKGTATSDGRPAPDELASASVTVGQQVPTEVLGQELTPALPRTS